MDHVTPIPKLWLGTWGCLAGLGHGAGRGVSVVGSQDRNLVFIRWLGGLIEDGSHSYSCPLHEKITSKDRAAKHTEYAQVHFGETARGKQKEIH